MILKKRSEPSSAVWKPKRYQLRAVKFLLSNGAGGLFLDPGLGKTSISLSAMSVLLNESIVRAFLVIAPLRVCYSVWRQEAEKWEQFRGLRFSLLHGPKKDDALREEADVYLINPEGLPWLEANLKKLRADALVVDESTKFKHTNTARFKLLRRVLNHFRRRYILTGTPAPNGLEDLFGQIFILDGGASLGRYVSHYRAAYFDQVGFDYILKDGAEKAIQKAIKPLVVRMSAEEYLELPALLVNDIRVDLPEKAFRIYKDMERELVALLEGGAVITASSAAAASMKCRQIANGGLYKPRSENDPRRGDDFETIHAAKVEALEDLVEELSGQPILVAYEFQHDLERLRDAFGRDVPYIGGGVSPKRGDALAVAWNEGRLPLLLGHPASMGHGLNLQGGGNHVGFFSLPWDLEHYDQFIRRVWRQGASGARVTVHRLIARKTIDEVISVVLAGKTKTQTELLKALRGYVRKKVA